MRILLDECVPRRFARELAGHEVSTVPQQGWAGVKNGELLRRVAGAFDVLVTVDANVPAQQIVAGRPFGVVVMRASSNRYDVLKPLAPKVLDAIADLQAGQVVVVEAET